MPTSRLPSQVHHGPRAFARPGWLCSTGAAVLLGCQASEPPRTPTTMLLPDTIDEWVRQDTSVTYDRETIFDYINGAGEVYRSYGFDHVLVDRYEAAGGQGVTVEVFDMGTPDDAFGVFSYSREQEEEGIGAGFEHKGSILCFWQNRFFVCVAAEQRGPEAEGVLTQVARGLSSALPTEGSPPLLMTTLPTEDLIPFSDRFFHTHQSLNYHYYLARENVLDLGPETDVALARYRPGSTYILVIGYEGEGEASAALSSFRSHVAPGNEGAQTVLTEAGSFHSSGRHGRYLVVVLGAEREEVAEALRAAALENLERLPH